ncbi:MAG: CHAD domain-containing protein [Acidimicrobiales bacterium]
MSERAAVAARTPGVPDGHPDTHGFTEREVKLSAWPGFSLPSLDEVADGVLPEALEARVLDAVYYDTRDMRLARWGVTMRFRAGDGTGWTVKLPEGDDGPALVRREVQFPGPSGLPPAEAVELVRAFVRRAKLVPVARLRTRRRGVALRDGEGHRLAEVVDDEVTVLDGRRVAARFREVEVEVDDRAPEELLGLIIERLVAAGAGESDNTPKVVRALGARATAPPEVEVPEIGAKPTAAEVVRAALARSVSRTLVHDPGVRLGDDPEDVHQARVGTRRMRSDLRTFAPLLAEGWAEPLRDELKWLGSLLGDVRDADVLTDRLRHQAADLPEVDAAGFAPLLRRLADERELARARMLEGMSSARYVALLDRLVAVANGPQLSPDADLPAADVLAPLVAAPMKKLRKTVKALPPEPAPEELHEVRIKAKRARYAAEAVAPAFGKPAETLAKAVAGVQGVLGDHQDAMVAESWLRQAVEGADVGQALTLGELVAVQRAEAAARRGEWRKAWKKANKKKRRAWLATDDE